MLRRPPRSLLTALAAALVVAAAGCDTGDGKTMRPPTSDQRANMPTTTTTAPAGAPVAGDVEGGVGTSAPVTVPATVAPAAFVLSVPWTNGGVIDARFTCDGADLSPPLTWTAPPAGTVELALLDQRRAARGAVLDQRLRERPPRVGVDLGEHRARQEPFGGGGQGHRRHSEVSTDEGRPGRPARGLLLNDTTGELCRLLRPGRRFRS